MVACVFSACSKDDVPNVPTPSLENDATLTVAFNVSGTSGSSLKSATKAVDDQFGAVGRIGLAIFNDGAMGTAMAAGTLLGYEEIDNVDNTTSPVAAKSGDIKYLVIANPKANMFDNLTTLDQYLAVIDDVTITPASLLMSSSVHSLTLAAGDNTSGTDKIKLYRNVARVEVPSITVSPREGFGKATTVTFKLKSIFVSNVRKSVRVGGKYAGTSIINPELEWNSVMNGEAELLTGDLSANTDYSKAISKTIEYRNSDVQPAKSIIDGAQIFVYDNSYLGDAALSATDSASMSFLTIKGDYTYTTSTGASITATDSYWKVRINHNTRFGAVDAGYPTHIGVLRNVKYIMNVTITGPGSGNTDEPGDPDDPSTGTSANLTATVDVVNWAEIVHDPSID